MSNLSSTISALESRERKRGKPREGATSSERLSRSAHDEFERDVLAGLSSPRKTLPCKYFYDARGSQLFEAICETPEYYVTRTEVALLKEACPKVATRVGPGVDVLEPGSGAGTKIRLLLDFLSAPRSFIPIDISESAVTASAEALQRDYPDVAVHPLVADFTRPFAIPPHFLERESDGDSEQRKLIFFPGSTISNFTPDEAAPFLQGLRGVLGAGDYLFIGVDRIKDGKRLERAYDDSAGVTAAFNKNLLVRIKSQLETDLDLRHFRHRAVYNEDLCRIEMHLVSTKKQVVHVCDRPFAFEEGETIHTENSYKYSVEGFSDLARRAGFNIVETFSDPEDLFSLYLCQVPG